MTIQESVTQISGGEEVPASAQDHDKNGAFVVEPNLPNDPTVQELEQGRMAHADAIQREMEASAIIRRETANSYLSDSSSSSEETSIS
jgi:hypothetical protein